MPFRVVCSHCGAKLAAKEKLIGHTKPCPRCKEPVLIEAPHPAEDEESVSLVQETEGSTQIKVRDVDPIGAVHVDRPDSLQPLNKYFIVDYKRLVAFWEHSKGWMLNVGAGFAPAKRNREEIPDAGKYMLVEIVVHQTDHGHRMKGLCVYELAKRWALPAIGRETDAILEKITGEGSLGRDEKMYVLQYLRKHYMHEFLDEAEEVLDFLTNEDYHSSKVGQIEPPEADPSEG